MSEIYKTKTGRSMSDAEIEALADEAERGYDIAALEAKRVAEGVCRHCGGRVPCWSPYGDSAVGKKYKHGGVLPGAWENQKNDPADA